MSGDHPQLILDGVKAMTRRTWGLEEINKDPDNWIYKGFKDGYADFSPKVQEGSRSGLTYHIKCPYGGVGNWLWVKEAWAVDALWDNKKPSEINPLASVWYFAATDLLDIPLWVGKKRPSLFMPRWASRIERTIDSLRPERLQEITEEDALAEGIIRQTDTGNNIFWYEVSGQYHGNTQAVDAVKSYAILWDSLNAKRGYSWESNPWDWVIGW